MRGVPVALTRKPWSDKEDARLMAAVARYGSLRWSHIARALPGRTSKACSHRWHTHLAPGAKRHDEEQEPFSDWELAVIREAHARLGLEWATIARLLPGRTEAAIRQLAGAPVDCFGGGGGVSGGACVGCAGCAQCYDPAAAAFAGSAERGSDGGSTGSGSGSPPPASASAHSIQQRGPSAGGAAPQWKPARIKLGRGMGLTMAPRAVAETAPNRAMLPPRSSVAGSGSGSGGGSSGNSGSSRCDGAPLRSTSGGGALAGDAGRHGSCALQLQGSSQPLAGDLLLCAAPRGASPPWARGSSHSGGSHSGVAGDSSCTGTPALSGICGGGSTQQHPHHHGSVAGALPLAMAPSIAHSPVLLPTAAAAAPAAAAAAALHGGGLDAIPHFHADATVAAAAAGLLPAPLVTIGADGDAAMAAAAVPLHACAGAGGIGDRLMSAPTGGLLAAALWDDDGADAAFDAAALAAATAACAAAADAATADPQQQQPQPEQQPATLQGASSRELLLAFFEDLAGEGDGGEGFNGAPLRNGGEWGATAAINAAAVRGFAEPLLKRQRI